MNRPIPALLKHVPVEEKVIAFTFDDGPHPLYTKQLLEIFESVNGKATFFMVGKEIESHEEVAKQVHAAGHELGNHTETHPALPSLAEEEIRAELERTDERIRSITGSSPASFRPPYMAVNPELLSLASEMGYASIDAVNGAAKDWDRPGVPHIVEETRRTVQPGSILIFHDGDREREQTVEAVRILAEELTAEGYRLVTVSELLRLQTEGKALSE
ncbi:polysaccharide deacetylase family protein [Gorillibacterium sp. CAU 1737]|uniref:polysaccharide deacetylase family protein n=1 Tax=Gorillibacterium sp. CAU 1737 TaxID=3140362 RepID=UPI003260CF73